MVLILIHNSLQHIQITNFLIKYRKENKILIKEKEIKKDTAWMVRQDGKMISVLCHIYGNEEEILSKKELNIFDFNATIEAAVWLYQNSEYDFVKEMCINFISSWIYDVCSIKKKNVDLSSLFKIIETEVYLDSKCKSFIQEHNNILFTKSVEKNSSTSLGKIVCDYLDQEFLRVRIGGLYDSIKGNRHLYCRISSQGYDWFNIIKDIVLKLNPSNITICRDIESTGYEGYFKYKDYIFNEIPLNEFSIISKEYVNMDSNENMLTKISSSKIISNYERLRILENKKYIKNKEAIN